MGSHRHLLSALALAGLTAAPIFATPQAIAAPLGSHAAQTATKEASLVQEVQRRGGGWRGGRRHWGGIGPGIVGGAILGSALAAPYYYGYAAPRRYYSDDDAPTHYRYRSRESAESYCSRRFKSYDPDSGTYMGYDGIRHACP